MSLPAKQSYPGLYNLVRTYFDQDYDVYGNTVEEIVSAFRDDNAPEFVQQTVEDISSFLARHPHGEEALKASFLEEFRPEVNFYDWHGRSMRETLVLVQQVLQRRESKGPQA